MRGERQIDVVAIRIVEARAHDGGFQIVVPDDARDTADIPKRPLM